MGSGNKRLQMNTRERALSSDINRLQAFHDSDFSQVFWEMFGRHQDDDDNSPGTETDPGAAASPPYAGILNGLRAYPVNGTVNMMVTPGTMLVENPATGVDDNPFKFIRDPGVVAAGALTMTAGGADVRIDVLEVAPVDAVVETDNRDIYNNGNGTFAPAVVTKVTAGRLQYRIRLGVEGGGLPANAAGWVPIAVFKVPANAATWDDCDIWDVRPLVSEKWNAPFDTRTSVTNVEVMKLVADETDAAPGRKLRLYGSWKGVWRGQRIDGNTGNYPSGATYIDINDTTTNLSSNWALPATNELWYLYLAFPGGLPGWRKYSPAPDSPRKPLGQRGIPVLSNIASLAVTREPSAPVGLPTSCGIGGTTSDAVCLCAGIVAGGNELLGFTQVGKVLHHSSLTPAVNADVSDPLGSNKSSYNFMTGVMGVPQGAASMLLQFELALTGAGAATENVSALLKPKVKVRASNPVNNDVQVLVSNVPSYVANGGNSASWKFVVELPIPFDLGTIDVEWNVTSAYSTFTTVTQDKMTFLGYRTA